MDSLTQSAMSLAQSVGLWGYWFAFFPTWPKRFFTWLVFVGFGPAAHDGHAGWAGVF